MMFDEAFLRQIDNIITRTKEAKFLLYSASISSTMNSFIKNYFGSYDLVDTSDQHELKIEHRLVRINYETRNEALNKIIDNLNPFLAIDRKSTRLNSSHVRISYAVFCLKKKK